MKQYENETLSSELYAFLRPDTVKMSFPYRRRLLAWIRINRKVPIDHIIRHGKYDFYASDGQKMSALFHFDKIIERTYWNAAGKEISRSEYYHSDNLLGQDPITEGKIYLIRPRKRNK